jgi:hypothetical protein
MLHRMMATIAVAALMLGVAMTGDQSGISPQHAEGAAVFAGLPSSAISNDPEVISGQVVDRSKRPIADAEVLLYIATGDGLQSTTTDANGAFSFRTSYSGAVQQQGDANGQAVNFRVELASSTPQGQIVSRQWDGVQWVVPPPQSATVQVISQAARSAVAKAANSGDMYYRCVPASSQYFTAKAALGTVGVGNDTTAQFSYGVQDHAETSFGLSVGFKGVNVIGGGTLRSTTNGGETYHRFRANTNQQVLGTFQFQRQVVARNAGSKKGKRCYTQVLPVRWLVRDLVAQGIRSENGVRAGNCASRQAFPPDHVVAYGPGSGFVKEGGTAAVQTQSVNVAGVQFDTQSGYSDNVSQSVNFGHRYNHYLLCGTGGSNAPGDQAQPESWSSIYAGPCPRTLCKN